MVSGVRLMERLPLRRLAEVAFLASNVGECVEFYRKLGLEMPQNLEHLNFAQVGEQLFGVCDATQGFGNGRGGFVKARLHVAFEISDDELDECIGFLKTKGIETSPKHEFTDWHGVRHSTSVYFTDPAGNIMELWAPRSKES